MKKIIDMRQDGFTLIEILMAILIIVILAVVGVTQFNNFAADAKNAATKSNLAILRNAIGSMNALERVRCAKTAVLFPDVGTVNNNDITGCTGAVATAACYPITLRDPRTGAAYAASCAAALTGATNYNSLIPPNDRPYVQNVIPNNPWTGPKATSRPNLVTADVVPLTGTAVCGNAPDDTVGAMAIATRCGTAAAAGGPHGGTAFDSVAVTEAGWCYCQTTGQVWANTANNDGLAAGTGIESNF